MTRIATLRGLKGKPLGIVSLLLLGACAAQQNDANPDACANPKSVACIHTGGTGSNSGGTGNSAGTTASGGDMSVGGTSDPGASGSTSIAGTSDPGSAGTTSTTGGAAGTTASGGASGTGTTNGGAGAGGTAGAGGAAAGTGGNPAGGASAGAGGAVNVGGSGGSTSALCTTAIPVRTSWVGTASSFSNVCTDPTYGLCNPPAYAFDADPKSRFSTGVPQSGTEWLQIDLTTKGTVDQVTVSVSNGDFGRHLQIRMSDTDKDTASAVLAEMDGVTGLMTFKFAPKTARYILISQTKALVTGETSWWSVQDLTAACN